MGMNLGNMKKRKMNPAMLTITRSLVEGINRICIPTTDGHYERGEEDD